MNQVRPKKYPERRKLDHSIHFAARFGGTYFITICCHVRGTNQLCIPETATTIFETASRYHAGGRWYLKILLLMPDHLHLLAVIPGDNQLSNLIRDFKRVTAKMAKITWQRNFFDHRLRHDESEMAKAQYIRENPIRGGLIDPKAKWRYVIDINDVESPRR